MYVIAKYAEGEPHPAFMTLFRTHVCGVEFSGGVTVCNVKVSNMVFDDWFAEQEMGNLEWKDAKTELLSTSVVLVAGKSAVHGGITLYTADDESVISVPQAKACGLWDTILDRLLDEVENSRP